MGTKLKIFYMNSIEVEINSCASEKYPILNTACKACHKFRTSHPLPSKSCHATERYGSQDKKSHPIIWERDKGMQQLKIILILPKSEDIHSPKNVFSMREHMKSKWIGTHDDRHPNGMSHFH